MKTNGSLGGKREKKKGKMRYFDGKIRLLTKVVFCRRLVV